MPGILGVMMLLAVSKPLLALLLSSSPALAQGSADERLRPWGPEQACGAPDTPEAGDHPAAWASRTEDGQDEWLEVEYPSEIVPTAMRVFESFHPGALRAIHALDAGGNEHELWRGVDPTPPSAKKGASLIPLAAAPATRRLRLELASSEVRGWNEIDAVGVHDASGALHWAVAARASTTFASGAAASDRAIHALPSVPLSDLPDGWRSSADGLFEIYLRMAGAQDADSTLLADLATQIEGIQSVAVNGLLPRGFGGRWKSTYGVLVLTLDGNQARGTYPLGKLAGTVRDNRLDFTYDEGRVKGTGFFVLSADEQDFEGRWHPDGTEETQSWTATRLSVPDGSTGTWLVILESPWQSALDEAEYSFGGMLRAIFEKNPGQQVRQRFFSDAESFQRYCAEAALLPGKVVLVVAAHGGPEGIHCQAGAVKGPEIAAALASMQNLQTVHFSSCAVMAGDVPAQIASALESSPVFEGVSGYETPVDWMASALTEFTYLELLLARGLAAPVAAEVLTRVLTFAGDAEVKGSPIPAAHFRFRGPARAVAAEAGTRQPGPD